MTSSDFGADASDCGVPVWVPVAKLGCVNEWTQGVTPAAGTKAAAGWRFAAFRQWRERNHPRAAYQIAPRLWRPEMRAQFEAETDAKRQAMKNWEPHLTGMAYSDRAVYLVEVAAELSAESMGRLLFLGGLFRQDPDYSEQRGK